MSKHNTWADVAFDCETLSTRPNAAIVAIAAVAFDRHSGDLNKLTFYRVIKVDSAIRSGHLDANTLAWWLRQPPEAMNIFTDGQDTARDLHSALADLRDWWNGNVEADACPWGNGATADITWLESAYHSCVGMQAPWQRNFWKIRDQRTLLDAANEALGFFQPGIEFAGVKHNALDDAKHQARVICEAFSALRRSAPVADVKQPVKKTLDKKPQAVNDDEDL